MEPLRTTLDSTDGQVATVSRTSSPPPLDLLTPPIVAEYWCHTQVRVTKMKYVWTISNFSFCREEIGEVVKSSFFSCGPNDKLKWCLRINPKGLDEESREYLSLYLLLVNCGTKSEARAKFKFSILNAKREETKAMESQRAYRFVQGKDWGFKKFIRRDVLMDEANGLLPNDRLTILCEVSVVGDTVSESGQVNNQPISVADCNLHEDIGSLLFKQVLTDVTLVVISPNNCENMERKGSATPSIMPAQGSGSSFTQDTTDKFPDFGRMRDVEDEADDADEEDYADEDDEQEDEDADLFDDEGEADADQPNDSDQEDSNMNSSSVGTESNNLLSDRSEAEACREDSSVASEAYSTTTIATLTGLTLAPATTTIAKPARGVIVPIMPSSGVDVSAVEDDQRSTAANRRLASSSTSAMPTPAQPVRIISNDARFDVHCDACATMFKSSCSITPTTSIRCPNCIQMSIVSTPSTSPLPTTSGASTTSRSRLSISNPACVGNEVVGSSSGSTNVCTPNTLRSATTTLTSDNPSGSVDGPVEAETSTRVRRSNRRRNTPSNSQHNSKTPTSSNVTNTTTTSSTSRSSRSRSSRDTPMSTTTVAKAGSTTAPAHSGPTSSTTFSTEQQSHPEPKQPDLQIFKSPVLTVHSNLTAQATSKETVILRQFEAHKAILAARSPVFAAMFEHCMEESRANRVEITDMEPDTLAEVLRYMYTGQVVGLDKLAHELLAAADKYQLERLKSMCEESLVESLSVENSCGILGLADMHNAEQLKSHALDFIMLHAHDVCETEGYEELVHHRPRLLNECFRSLASQQLPLRCWGRKRPRQS